uniref:Uncharacterized protein n=1 Tax=Trieres chinensis TaxID=1514140 RepID=A0A7S2A0F0_TRICV|mmetsp:Transcript_37007/g.75493  ORF Transcript_37007/g.75493 Transcript_37007/m.75493 type:complete len:477 (+) Transcript_37007:84-1514(+)
MRHIAFIFVAAIVACVPAHPVLVNDDVNDDVQLRSSRFLEEDEFGTPFEFGGGGHDGHAHGEDPAEGVPRPWSKVIGFSILINISTLVGVIFLIPSVYRARLCCSYLGGGSSSSSDGHPHGHHGNGRCIDVSIPSFASGALLGTAVFLIIPEALHHFAAGSSLATQGTHGAHEDEGDSHAGHGHVRLLEEDTHEDHGNEAEVAWKFGSSLLGGFLFPILLGALFPRAKEHDCDSDCGENEHTRDDVAGKNLLGRSSMHPDGTATAITHGMADEKAESDEEIGEEGSEDDAENDKGFVEEQAQASVSHNHGPRKLRSNIDYRLAVTILLGDGFHNFADGIFVGIGFMLCSNEVAMSIMVVTLFHEIAQELADFFLLTKHAGLTVPWALFLNFCSGISVLLGGVTILAVPLTNELVGVFLTIAAGVYIQVAASECMPRVEDAVRGWQDRILSIVIFILGALPIGLCLINHQHCEADSH